MNYSLTLYHSFILNLITIMHKNFQDQSVEL